MFTSANLWQSTHSLVFTVAYGHDGLPNRSAHRLSYESSHRSCAPRFGVQSAMSGDSSTLAKRHRVYGGVAPCAGVAVVRDWSGRYRTDAKAGRDVS